MDLDPEKAYPHGDGHVPHPGKVTGADDLSASKTEDADKSSHSASSVETANAVPVEAEEIQEIREAEPLGRSKSSSSQLSRVAVIVPRSKRRGLWGRFTLIPEVEIPYDYKNTTKWLITLEIALAAVAAPIGSAIFYPALPEISRDLHATPTVTNLSVAMYMLSMAIFPLWWSSFSETLGRRTIYIVSFALFTIWNVASALSTSIGMLIAMRVLGGGAAASVQVVGAGTIADMWEPRERGLAMGIFYLGPLLGPLFGPIIGGVLTQAWGWRSTQWFLVIYGGILWIGLTSCLPETLARTPDQIQPEQSSNEKNTLVLTQVLTRESIHKNTKKLTAFLKRGFVDPLKVLHYLRYPAVLIIVSLASVTFGSLYMLNISIQQTFSEPPYNYRVIIIGLLYIPNSVGYILASGFGGRWTDRIMAREARRAGRYDESGKLIVIPEDRMRENAWIAAAIFPAALVWYGWSAARGLIWIVPMIPLFFFGLGSMVIFAVATTMLTEFFPRRSSSAVAVNNFVRNIFSCIAGVVAQPIISAIGDGWLFLGLGVICWTTAFSVIWALRKFGPRWRVKMVEHMGS